MFTGSSTLNQLEKIVDVLGMPSAEAVAKIDSAYIKTMLESLSNHNAAVKTINEQKDAWSSIYPKVSEDAIDLLTRLMQYNPEDRLTAASGLSHPYCNQFHDEVRDKLS